MSRPDRSHERRAELIPVVARCFAELGYRRTTTAELARRCGVQETILYRLWNDKRAMFLASIEHVAETSTGIWAARGLEQGQGSPAERILRYEAEHHGELGFYRILFAGLGETDDPEIREALKASYRRFATWIEERIAEHRNASGSEDDKALDAALAAWAAVGLGTMINIGRELELFEPTDRARLLSEVGRLLLDG